MYQKQPDGLGEEQLNAQHQATQKYHYGHVEEQFKKNDICDMQTNILT